MPSNWSPTVISFVGGASVELDLPDDEVQAVRSSLGFAVEHPSGRPPDARYVRDRSGSRVVRHDPLRDPVEATMAGGIDSVIDDLHLTIALHAVDELFIHAGVVAVDGLAVVIPGRSHAGKSTLVDELVRSGARYLSDEYARVTADGGIRAYSRPIRLRTATGRRLVEPDGVGPDDDTALQPGLVLVTRYQPDADFAPRPMTPARAALELFDNVVVARIAPVRAMAAVAAIARTAPALHTLRPDAVDVAPKILAMVGDLTSGRIRAEPLEQR